MSEPRWLTLARAHLGVRETKGPKHNTLIVKWWTAIRSAIRDDESPWCAAFVGAVLEEAGVKSSRSAAARSYQKWGTKLPAPALGAVAVFWRGSPTGWSGYVGFVAGKDALGNLMILGGNQGDMVSIKPFSNHRLLGCYWPLDAKATPDVRLPVLRSDGRVSQNEA